MDEKEIKRNHKNSRKKAEVGKKAPAILQNQRRRSHPAARRLRAEREDKQVGRMRKLCQERQP